MRKIVISVAIICIAFTGLCFAADEAAQKQFVPKRVEVDSNFDGKVDRVEYYDANGQISRVEVDSKGTGKTDEWIIYKNGVPVKKEKDTNGDGKPDVWITY